MALADFSGAGPSPRPAASLFYTSSVPQGRSIIAHRFNGGYEGPPPDPAPAGAKEGQNPADGVLSSLPGLVWGAAPAPSDESLGYALSPSGLGRSAQHGSCRQNHPSTIPRCVEQRGLRPKPRHLPLCANSMIGRQEALAASAGQNPAAGVLSPLPGLGRTGGLRTHR